MTKVYVYIRRGGSILNADDVDLNFQSTPHEAVLRNFSNVGYYWYFMKHEAYASSLMQELL